MTEHEYGTKDPRDSRHVLCAKSLQLCLILCDPMDCSPPGSSDHGILQARILEWVAISFSRVSSWPRDWTHISYISSCTARQVLNHKHHLGSPVGMWLSLSSKHACSLNHGQEAKRATGPREERKEGARSTISAKTWDWQTSWQIY